MKQKWFGGIFLAAVLSSATHAAAEGPQPGAAHPACLGGDLVTASWEEARRSGVEFRAVGLAPRWTLELAQGPCMHFTDHDATTFVSASMPEPLRDVRSSGMLYGAHSATHELHVGIERKPCASATESDAMSHTVIIRVDGKEYTGCGRSLPVRP